MPLTPQVSLKDVVFIQRSDDNSFYGEAHISGAKMIFYLDDTGHINADESGSFYTVFPPSPTGTVSLSAGTAVVNTSFVQANSIILLTGQNSDVNAGALFVSARTAGVSFTVSSTNILSTQLVGWYIINPS
jgi:hypothetical protein